MGIPKINDEKTCVSNNHMKERTTHVPTHKFTNGKECVFPLRVLLLTHANQLCTCVALETLLFIHTTRVHTLNLPTPNFVLNWAAIKVWGGWVSSLNLNIYVFTYHECTHAYEPWTACMQLFWFYFTYIQRETYSCKKYT